MSKFLDKAGLDTLWAKIKAKFAAIDNSVYFVAGTHDYPAWVANKAYAVGDPVSTGNTPYTCKTAHTSGSSFDSTKWNRVATPVWKGTIPGVTELKAGLKIAYKIPIAGGSTSTYLNINNLGNKYVYRNTGHTTTHLPINTVVFLTYDGAGWKWADYSVGDNYYAAADFYCNTGATTAAKAATGISFGYDRHKNIAFRIYFTVANTLQGQLTLNVNARGAKNLFINGTNSSTSNYTIPIGVYWCYYDGAQWQLWTDKSIWGLKVRGDGSSLTEAFTAASSRSNIATGETNATIFGKIAKWFSDLKALAFKDKVSDSDINGTISDSHVASAATWNAKADDSAVVHKTGAETITGIKTFNNDVSPRQTGNGFMKQSKNFVCSFIKLYSEWSAAEKDNNHFRTWTLDITSTIVTASTHGNIVVKLMGSYYNNPSNGALQKEITFQVYNGDVRVLRSDYTVAQSPCADEFAISDVYKSGSSYFVQVLNRNPTVNNYPLRLEIEMFSKNASAILDNVTLTEAITEGLPSWAVDVAQVTASGSPVLTEATAADVAKTGSYNDLSNKPTFGTAAFKDVPASGDATSTQVVMGGDSRLTDSRTPKAHNHDDRYYTESEIDTKLSGKLGTSGNGSSVTVTPDGTSTGTDIGSSTTLKAWAQKFKNLVSSLKTVAFSGQYSDLSGSPSIPDDTTLVHKAGSETITGLKTFNNDVSPRQTGSSFTKQSKVFVCSVITPYADWTASQKDSNHYRTWTLDITSTIATASTHSSIIVTMMGSYCNTPGNGTLQKVITFQIYNGNVVISKGNYTVSQSPCGDEFEISDVFKSGSNYFIQVVNRKPTANNYPLRLEIEMFNRYPSAVLDNVTLAEAITEGLPSWAVEGAPVIATKVDTRWFYHNEAAGNDDRWYKLLSVTHESNTHDYAGDIFAVTTRDAGDNNVQALLAFSPYAAGSDQTAYAKLVVLNMRTNSLGPVVFKLARPDNTHYTIYAMLPKFSGVKIAPVACDGAIVYESDSYTSEPSGLAPVDKMVNTYTSSAVGVGSSLQPTYVGANGLVAPCSTLASFAAIHDIGGGASGYGDTSLTPIIPDYIYCQEKTDLIRQYSLNIQRLIEGKVYKVMFGNGGNSVEVVLMNHYNNDNHDFTVHHGSGSTVVGYWDFPDGSHSTSYTSHIMRTGEHVYIIDGY